MCLFVVTVVATRAARIQKAPLARQNLVCCTLYEAFCPHWRKTWNIFFQLPLEEGALMAVTE